MSQIDFIPPSPEQLSELIPAYEFEFLIAQGGMGAVYKARQRSLDRDVAIKVLPRELGHDPVFRESFAAEAQAMARLSHHHLIRVFDYGDADGMLFTVMEYVHGKSLHHSAYGKQIDAAQAVDIVLSVCHGLTHAHNAGIVHRDIKPANILLNAKCEPKIGDFGLARPTGHQSGGLVMGTPGYTAPEVLSHPEQGDRRSDIFAIGVILKELLTGIPADSPDFLQARIANPKLARICAKAIAPRADLRFADLLSLIEALESWDQVKTATLLQTSTPSVRPAPTSFVRPSLASASAGRTNWLLWRNCAIIAILLVAIGISWNAYTEKKAKIVEQNSLAREAPAKVELPRIKSQNEEAPLISSSRF
ncbi:MAG: serine/threonine-protein kinase [Verrucomicrobiota bacterium]